MAPSPTMSICSWRYRLRPGMGQGLYPAPACAPVRRWPTVHGERRTVGALLRDAEGGAGSEPVASTFDSFAVPAALAHALRLEPLQERADPTVQLPGGDLVVLVGPGVVTTGNIAGLSEFAAAANVPVAN